MKPQTLTPLISLVLTIVLLAACGAPAAEPTPIQPTATPIPPTPTPVPATATPKPEPRRSSIGTSKFEYGEITSDALSGNLIGDPATRSYWVYLPPDYDTETKRYPVVYVLHWYTGDEMALVTDVRLALERLHSAADAQDMILVFPDASNKFRGSWYMSSPTIGDYETYITSELVDQIDASFRTIPHRDSRGVTGCSMGGDGAMHLALKYPDLFGTVVGVSGTYDYENDPVWEDAREKFEEAPENLSDFGSLPWDVQWYIAGAAATASNPDKPPFYLDMPFEVVDGETQIVKEVWEKINASDTVHDVQRYLEQPTRLNAVMIYHGDRDNIASVDNVRAFVDMLSDLGVEHEYVEVENRQHCNLDWEPVIQFMSDSLVSETPEEAAEPDVSELATEESPETVIENWQEALNAGDVDLALSFLADDASIAIVPPAPGMPGEFSGKDEIRGWYEPQAAGNAQSEVHDIQVDGDQFVVHLTWQDDDMRGLGVELDFIIEGILQDGKIQSYTATMSEESLQTMEAAMAAMEAGEPGAPEVVSGYADNDGVGIYYEVEGEGPPLMLVHWWTGSTEDWRLFGYVDALKDDYQLILIDMRGHGQSDKPQDADAYAPEIQASDIVAVLDELGIDKAHYFGYSLGGALGWALAKYAPDRFHSFIIGGDAPQAYDSSEEVAAIGELGANGWAQFVQDLASATVDWEGTEVYEAYAGIDVEAVSLASLGLGEVDAEGDLPDIESPVLLLEGTNDPEYADVVEAADRLPNARLASLSGLDHVQAFMLSDQALPPVTEFLAEVSQE